MVSSPFLQTAWTYGSSPPLSQCVCQNGAVGTSCSACTLSSQCSSNQTCLSQPASLLTRPHVNVTRTLFCRSEPHGLLSSYLGEHRLELVRVDDHVELSVSSSLVELQPQLLHCEYSRCEVTLQKKHHIQTLSSLECSAFVATLNDCLRCEEMIARMRPASLKEAIE